MRMDFGSKLRMMIPKGVKTSLRGWQNAYYPLEARIEVKLLLDPNSLHP